MDVRTFEGLTMHDAVKSVRNVFGKEAVILKTQEKPSPNGKGRSFVITAARGGESVDNHDESDKSDQAIYEIVNELRSLKSEMSMIRQKQVSREDILIVDGRIEDLRNFLFNRESSTSVEYNLDYAEIMYVLEAMNFGRDNLRKLAKYLDKLPHPGEEGISDYYKQYAIRWIMKRVIISPNFFDIRNDGKPGIHVICGSSGSGKTTAVAKIAAWLKKDHGYDPFIVSLDSNSIGGSEQLRIFCKVLGIDFKSVESGEDLKNLSDKFPGRPIIVDTAGQNPKYSKSLAELQALGNIEGLDPCIHLVMSLANRPEHLERVVQRFASLSIQSLIFSKIDESWVYGDIFGLSSKWGIPLSFFSTGSHVPDDIEKATRERVVERIFGLGEE